MSILDGRSLHAKLHFLPGFHFKRFHLHNNFFTQPGSSATFPVLFSCGTSETYESIEHRVHGILCRGTDPLTEISAALF